jgi:hypothetical protein
MSSNSRVDAILAQFPGPVTLYASRAKWLLALVICLLFVAAAIWGMWSMGTTDPRGWMALIFFGVGAVVAGAMLIPGVMALRLDHDGFERVWLFHRCSLSPWEDVSEFKWIIVQVNTMVIYNNKSLSGRMSSKLRAALWGRTNGLPDTYDLSGDELVDVMSHWRERALSQSP